MYTKEKCYNSVLVVTLNLWCAPNWLPWPLQWGLELDHILESKVTWSIQKKHVITEDWTVGLTSNLDKIIEAHTQLPWEW